MWFIATKKERKDLGISEVVKMEERSCELPAARELDNLGDRRDDQQDCYVVRY